MQQKSLKILGLMSGTSLDGLDLALCEFSAQNKTVSFTLLASKTIAYEPVWKERLQSAFDCSAEQYFKLHSLYGEFTGVRTARKHIGWYVRDLPGSDIFRDQLNTLENSEDQVQAVEQFMNQLNQTMDRMPYRQAPHNAEAHSEEVAA